MKGFEAAMSFAGGLDDVDRLRAWFDSLPWGSADIDGRTLSRIRLALAEAYTNAHVHAHRGVSGQSVDVRVTLSPDPKPHVRLDVTDRGPGFVMPPVTNPGDDAERGRGLMILRTIAERVEYRQNTLSLWIATS